MTKEINPGTFVQKSSGYTFPGVVIARFTTLGGSTRYVVESLTSPGLLHIFNRDQLIPVNVSTTPEGDTSK